MASIDPASNLAGDVAKVISLFKTDPTVKAQIGAEHQAALDQADLSQLEGQIQIILAQLQVDAVEAASKSIFVSGWRPWVGWIAGTAMGSPFLIYVIESLVAIVRGIVSGHVELPPVPDTALLLTTLTAILGMGTLRTVEKVQGAAAPGNIGH